VSIDKGEMIAAAAAMAVMRLPIFTTGSPKVMTFFIFLLPFIFIAGGTAQPANVVADVALGDNPWVWPGRSGGSEWPRWRFQRSLLQFSWFNLFDLEGLGFSVPNRTLTGGGICYLAPIAGGH
jgi:hypothetical protein